MQIVVNEQLKDAIEWICKYASEYKVDIDIHIDAGGEISVSVCPTYRDTADTPQTESTGSPIGDYRDGVGAWQTERMTEEEVDTMLAKALVGHTDCGWGKPNE